MFIITTMSSNFMHAYSVAQSCLTLWDPRDCSPPGSSVHGIFQARILEWVAFFYSRGSSWPRDKTHISLSGFFFFFCKSTIIQFFYYFYFFSVIFISWRLITLQHCSGFCHTLKWISQGFTCIPHPGPPSHLPLHLIPLGLTSAPGPSTCLMHPTWAGDLFHPR